MPLEELLSLTRRIGDPAQDLVILAEGNTSARASDDSFYVKASGSQMRDIAKEGFVEVLFSPVLAAMETMDSGSEELRRILNDARSDRQLDAVPSTEAFMHAYLLSLPDNNFVVHTHPSPLLSLLSGRNVEELCAKRLFPDEIVCCGPATAFVPYVAPGLLLAQEIRLSTETFQERYAIAPKTYWLQNHGLITVGRTAREAEAATLMAVKAARVWLGLLSAGLDVKSLTEHEVDHIFTWPDEHFRQKKLGF